MNIQLIRRGTILFFVLFIIAVTWPGMLLGNRVLPLFLGLPLSMVWIATWVVLSFLVLALLDWAEGKARTAGDEPPAGSGGHAGSGEER